MPSESNKYMHSLRTLAGITCLAILAVPAILASNLPSSTHAATIGPTILDHGYSDMYNLNFAQAHQEFATWMQTYPTDPMGPVSDAAAYLFTEFTRLGVLDIDLFDDDDNFEGRNKKTPDPVLKVAFNQDLGRANQLADAALAMDPHDTRALFVKTLTSGLHADYAQMIENRDFAGLKYTEVASKYADQLLAIAPQDYDAYLAVGLENYILGLKPAPVRWLLHLTGAQTNAVLGKRDMNLVATKGHYLAPFARLLLAVAALRDKDTTKARLILASLAQEFPNNPLYARQLAKIH